MITSFRKDANGWWIEKDPAAIKDYTIDWVDFLVTDTISTSVWAATTGITTSSPSKTDTTTTVWLTGGTAGVTYTISNTITTAGGRTEKRSFRVVVKAL